LECPRFFFILSANLLIDFLHESQIFDPANAGILALSAFEILQCQRFYDFIYWMDWCTGFWKFISFFYWSEFEITIKNDGV